MNAIAIALEMDEREVGLKLEPLTANPDSEFTPTRTWRMIELVKVTKLRSRNSTKIFGGVIELSAISECGETSTMHY